MAPSSDHPMPGREPGPVVSPTPYPCNRAWLVRAVLLCLLGIALLTLPGVAEAQDLLGPTPTPAPGDEPIEVPDRVEVRPGVRDEEIRARLESILQATGWFTNPEVRVEEGVVFLLGQTETQERKTWAGDLARRTTDVAAVVNQIELSEPSVWDIEPAVEGLQDEWQSMVRAIPWIGFSVIILLLTYLVARLAAWLIGRAVRNRDLNPLLRRVIAWTVGLIVFLAGLFLVFQVAGLTNVAFTVLGGTGLLGLILGIAFRDITENFLASIFLSLQTPFRAGDLVKIVDIVGVVQALTTRATVLMTLEGNHVQIPNATVYKSTILNYSSNPNRRLDFTIGIGYEDAISTAQEVAFQVLAEHPAVLEDPEPLVLVESLGSATVNLHIYFWMDASQHSWLKVKSSVIRLVKRAFQAAEISMPDEAREMIFPNGIRVQMAEQNGQGQRHGRVAPAEEESSKVSTHAEGGLRSETKDIEEQARKSRTPEEGEDLLQRSRSQ